MVFQELSLNGKTALVTGGGSGIGGGIARGLAEAGADIAVVYNRHAPTEMQRYVESLGRKFLAIQADVSDTGCLAGLVRTTVETFGHLDILVNCAGVCLRGPVLEHTEEMWDKTIQINEKTVYILSQLAAKQFIAQGTGGKIINIASMLSYLGGFNASAYAASKHAVMGITRALASEWGSLGINVNAIAPGWIKTNLSAPLVADPNRYSSVCARIPMGDWGEPDVFKGVAVLLASEAGRYINGATIPVDGGYLVK